MEEKQTLQVPCISGIIDLQKIVQRQKLHFSEETNHYLLYQTLKKVGPDEAQKLISKLVERGDIEWQSDETFEVENILDHLKEDDVSYYLIKWKGWGNEHNSWEPLENLNCGEMITAFHLANQNASTKTKKRRRPVIDAEERLKYSKKRRVDELFAQLVRSPLKKTITPLHLLSLSSPTKFKPLMYKGLVTSTDQKLPKFTIAPNYSSKRTKSYKLKKEEIQIALKEWEQKLNSISIDPAPIKVENDVDLEGPPENFEYIVDYKPGEGIEIPQDPLVGCECLECLHNKKGCCPASCGAVFAYYRYKRVRVPKGSPIYECNKRCLCGPECPNRVVQQGRKHKVSIFRTSNGRGWGVKALEKIKSGTFVMEYVGEVITNEEAERRGKVYDAECRTYLFDLDYNDGDCPFTVDAGYYGNVSHFVNHSCDPNLEVYGVWINTLDPRLPRIALFARRDIMKGEELTFDYMMTGDTTLQTAAQVAGTELSANPLLQDKFTVSPRMEMKKSRMSLADSRPSAETTPLLSPTEPQMPVTPESPNSDQSSQKHTPHSQNIPPEKKLPCSPMKSLEKQLPSPLKTVEKQSPNSPVKSPQKQSLRSPVKSPQKQLLRSPVKSPQKQCMLPQKVTRVPVTSPQKQTPPSKEMETESQGQISSDVNTPNDISQTHDPSVASAELKSEMAVPIRQQYRIVCQCGAANCRKYLF